MMLVNLARSTLRKQKRTKTKNCWDVDFKIINPTRICYLIWCYDGKWKMDSHRGRRIHRRMSPRACGTFNPSSPLWLLRSHSFFTPHRCVSPSSHRHVFPRLPARKVRTKLFHQFPPPSVSISVALNVSWKRLPTNGSTESAKEVCKGKDCHWTIHPAQTQPRSKQVLRWIRKLFRGGHLPEEFNFHCAHSK